MISQQGTHRVEEERAAPRQHGQLRGPSVPSDAHIAVLHPDIIPHVVRQNHPVAAPVHPDCSESSTAAAHSAQNKLGEKGSTVVWGDTPAPEAERGACHSSEVPGGWSRDQA